MTARSPKSAPNRSSPSDRPPEISRGESHASGEPERTVAHSGAPHTRVIWSRLRPRPTARRNARRSPRTCQARPKDPFASFAVMAFPVSHRGRAELVRIASESFPRRTTLLAFKLPSRHRHPVEPSHGRWWGRSRSRLAEGQVRHVPADRPLGTQRVARFRNTGTD